MNSSEFNRGFTCFFPGSIPPTADWSTSVLFLIGTRGLVIVCRLGGKGRGIVFGGEHFIFRRTKRESVVTENPKGGSPKTLEGFSRGTTQICLKNKDMGGGGGSRKSSNVIRGITLVK